MWTSIIFAFCYTENYYIPCFLNFWWKLHFIVNTYIYKKCSEGLLGVNSMVNGKTTGPAVRRPKAACLLWLFHLCSQKLSVVIIKIKVITTPFLTSQGFEINWGNEHSQSTFTGPTKYHVCVLAAAADLKAALLLPPEQSAPGRGSRMDIFQRGTAAQHLVNVMNALGFLHAHPCNICQENYYIIWSYLDGGQNLIFLPVE